MQGRLPSAALGETGSWEDRSAVEKERMLYFDISKKQRTEKLPVLHASARGPPALFVDEDEWHRAQVSCPTTRPVRTEPKGRAQVSMETAALGAGTEVGLGLSSVLCSEELRKWRASSVPGAEPIPRGGGGAWPSCSSSENRANAPAGVLGIG